MRDMQFNKVSIMWVLLMFVLFPCEIFGATNTATLSVSATVSGVNSMNITLLNTSDDQAAAKMVFSTTSGIAKANQYARIEYDSNALGARIIIRTDNKNSSKPYAGTGEGAGLVGNSDSTQSVPLLWVIYPDLASAKNFQFVGDTDPDGTKTGTLPGASPRPAGEAEGVVVDKATPQFESQAVLNFATVVLPSGANGLLGNFPTDEDGAGPKTGLRSAVSPVFLVLGADFVNSISQTYSTTALGFDLIVQ